MCVLGIDPGLANTGWAVIRRRRYVASGVIKTRPKELRAVRLQKVSSALVAIAIAHDIEQAAMETLFGGKRRIHHTAEMLGAIRLALWNAGYMVFDIAPAQAKAAVGHRSAAKKGKVAEGVARALNINVARMANHETDACAIALAYIGGKK